MLLKREPGSGAAPWPYSCAMFGIECKVYMVRVSYNQKPYRRIMMETWGAKCVPSPSPDTKAGRDDLAKDPNSNGSLGLAISEAVEDAVTHDDTHYSLGSVLNHVILHQTVIGQEDDETNGDGRLLSGYCHRLCGRWLQLRWFCHAVSEGQTIRKEEKPALALQSNPWLARH